MGGLAGASGALYERDSSRPGVFPAWEDRRAARGGRPRKQDAKRERASAAGEHQRQREHGRAFHRRVPVKQSAGAQAGELSRRWRAASVKSCLALVPATVPISSATVSYETVMASGSVVARG